MGGQNRKMKTDSDREEKKIKRLLEVVSAIVTEGSDWCSFGSSKLAFHSAITVRGCASCSFDYMPFTSYNYWIIIRQEGTMQSTK